MKRAISNPNRVHHTMYILIIAISVVALIISITVPTFSCKLLEVIWEVLKNLSYGCIASTLVAWIIDYVNVKKANQKANDIYDAIYADLQVSIGFFVGTWAEICAVCFKDNDYNNEKHSWVEWYEIVKSNYNHLEPERQQYLLEFFRNSLLQSTKYVNRSLEKITSQSYVLTINDAMNSELRSVMSDFNFEFGALNTDLETENYAEYFWDHIEAINNDLVNYINAWSDISFYNRIPFKPYEFFDVAKLLFAIEK